LIVRAVFTQYRAILPPDDQRDGRWADRPAVLAQFGALLPPDDQLNQWSVDRAGGSGLTRTGVPTTITLRATEWPATRVRGASLQLDHAWAATARL
jgi:hypothetical protein